MAINTGVTSGQGQEVDAISKAARVTLYDSQGNEIQQPPNGSYVLPINLRQTAATAATSVVWAMRNGTARVCAIRRINLVVGFDGTAATATTVRYSFQRFSGATPSGGATLTPVKKRTTYSASTIADARVLVTGLTTTGITFEPDAFVVGVPAAISGIVMPKDLAEKMSGERYDCFELQPNEGFSISLNVAAVIGQSLLGYIEWDER